MKKESDLLYYGPPAVNVGCVTPKGEALWDSCAYREAAWKAAVKAVDEARPRPAYLSALLRVAKEAQDKASHAALDALERHWLGELVTDGTHPKRVRFWRFVRRAAGAPARARSSSAARRRQ